MCGRLARTKKPEDLPDLFDVMEGSEELEGLSPSYNIAPTAALPALIVDRGDLAWRSFTWGFYPAWMRRGRPMINARVETVATKPMFWRAFRQRRCVLPVTAYYEWLAPATGPKQPYCIRPAGEEPLLLAGIYENGTCAILTRSAGSEISFIHNRMPVALFFEQVEMYLKGSTTLPVTVTAETLPLHAYPVTRRMNNSRFDDPACLIPVAM